MHQCRLLLKACTQGLNEYSKTKTIKPERQVIEKEVVETVQGTLDATVMEGHAENMGGSEALGKVQNDKIANPRKFTLCIMAKLSALLVSDIHVG